MYRNPPNPPNNQKLIPVIPAIPPKPLTPIEPIIPTTPLNRPLGVITVPEGLPNTITDCASYGNIIKPDLHCPAGKALFGGFCYDDIWTVNGGTKTAICTVDYGSFRGVHTECGIGIYYLNYGAPCPMLGPGYFKTAVCSCQLGGVVTASDYCANPSKPTPCPVGTDFLNLAAPLAPVCLGASCPTGYTRTDVCVCTKSSTL